MKNRLAMLRKLVHWTRDGRQQSDGTTEGTAKRGSAAEAVPATVRSILREKGGEKVELCESTLEKKRENLTATM